MYQRTTTTKAYVEICQLGKLKQFLGQHRRRSVVVVLKSKQGQV
jgi:hypothetical protein